MNGTPAAVAALADSDAGRAVLTLARLGDHAECDPLDGDACGEWDAAAVEVMAATLYGGAVWDAALSACLSRTSSHATPWEVSTWDGNTRTHTVRCDTLTGAAEQWADAVRATADRSAQ